MLFPGGQLRPDRTRPCEAALVRHWGRIGQPGTQRLDLYADEAAAANALTTMIRYRQRRGYSLA